MASSGTDFGSSTARSGIERDVHFAGTLGPRPKVFKLATLDLAAGEARTVRGTVSLRPMTTRRVHPGEHRVDARVNGEDHPIGGFVVR